LLLLATLLTDMMTSMDGVCDKAMSAPAACMRRTRSDYIGVIAEGARGPSVKRRKVKLRARQSLELKAKDPFVLYFEGLFQMITSAR
jgi:hypothetical protein